MPLIYETPNFTIIAPDRPHVARTDGGHIIITPKVPVEDRTLLTADLAKELMKLTMATGETMSTILNRHGVDLERINYRIMATGTRHFISIYMDGPGPQLFINMVHTYNFRRQKRNSSRSQPLNR